MAEEEDFFWFRYDDGQWIVFDESALVQIEDARKSAQESVRLINTPYLINLSFMQQLNENTGYPRDIVKAEACWYWLDDDGETWRQYNRVDSLKLALAALSPVGDHWTYLEHGQTLYYADINRLVQRNTATDYERNIHKGFPPPSLKQAAECDISHPNCHGTPAAAAVSPPFRIEDHASGIAWDDAEEDDDENNMAAEEDHYECPVPRNFICPLSKRIMTDPAQTVVGSTYERKYIERHLRRNHQDPSTDITLKSKSLLENRVLRDSIEAWKEKYSTKIKAKGADSNRIEQRSPQKPLTEATPVPPPVIPFTNDYVQSDTHQDTLKVILLGLSNFGSDVALRNPTTPSGKLGLNRYSWRLKRESGGGVHCNVYDFVGQKVHPATQRLFFSPQALYVVVWDLSLQGNITDDAALLERDVFEKVQFWVNAIEQQAGPNAIILPVVSLDGSFNNSSKTGSSVVEEAEIKRRCAFLSQYFDNLQRDEIGNNNKVNLFFQPDGDPMVRIGGPAANNNSDRLHSLKGCILEHCSKLFPNLGQSIPVSNQLLRDAVAHMAREGVDIVEVNQISEMLGIGDAVEILNALQYLSDAGEILYYGGARTSEDGILQKFAVLNPSWLVTAVAAILLPSINDAIRAVRRRNTLSDNTASGDENELYHGPVAAKEDIRALWQSQFQSHDSTMKPGINAESGQLFDYLQGLFTRIGIVVPLKATEREWPGGDFPSKEPSTEPSSFPSKDYSSSLETNLLFLPGLLSQRDQAQFVGIYNNSVFSKTTLAQSMHFRSLVSPELMEKICASVLGRIYAEVRRGESRQEGQLHVKEVVCWRTLLHAKLSLKTNTSSGDAQWSVVDIYAHLVGSSSPLCVGATFMGEAKQSLIVSGKGEEGNDGQVIWKGGFGLITEAIRGVLESSTHGMDFEWNYFCPSCLARQNLRDARSWSEIMLQTALGRDEEDLICEDGHEGKTQLVLRQPTTPKAGEREQSLASVPPDVHAGALMAGVVMVGLYDEKRRAGKIRKVGSGFVIDRERGLIVTAAHTLMTLWGQENFGRDYDGIEGAKAVIGVIPDNYDSSEEYPPALFRYFATIYVKDPSIEMGECHIDACILQLTSRFENDVEGNGDLCSDEISIRLTGKPALMKKQKLSQLCVTEEVHVGEPVRILGFDQPDSTRLNRTFGISVGRVYKQFETKTVGGERFRYTPRKKIVLNCPTIGGHSGGPCVNHKGQVIGILSCADFTEKSRCYLVPTSEWLGLIPERDEVVSRPSPAPMMKSVPATLKFPPSSLITAKKSPPQPPL